MAGRLCHLVSFFSQNPRLTLRSRHLTSFSGQIFLFHAIEGDNGHATLGRKRNPMCFQPTKGRSTQAKRKQNARNMRETREKHARNTRETCEKHARNMRVYPGANYTAPAPSSPSLMEIPAFSSGKKYPNKVSLSRSTNDSQDWSRYYVNQYVQVSTALAPHLSYSMQLC